MSDQKILDDAPEGATYIDGEEYLDAKHDSYWCSKKSKWCALCEIILQDDIRSLADIKELVDLRNAVEGFQIALTEQVVAKNALENENRKLKSNIRSSDLDDPNYWGKETLD